MFNSAQLLLSRCSLQDNFCFGGGTALAVHYWNHRYSTDIDIFIFGKSGVLNSLRDKNWDKDVIASMDALEYSGDQKFPGYYYEIAINEESKMQFFEVNFMTKTPYIIADVFDCTNIKIESVEEILAKKIYYRAEKGNARDLFDFAVAINKDPLILDKILDGSRVKLSHLQALENKIKSICSNDKSLEQYIFDIKEISPNPEYSVLASVTPQYLLSFLEGYNASLEEGVVLTKEDVSFLEKLAFRTVVLPVKNKALDVVDEYLILNGTPDSLGPNLS